MSFPKVNIVGCCFTRDLLRCVNDIYGHNYVEKFFQCNSPFTIGYDKLSDVTGINITIEDFKIGSKCWGKWFLTNAEETLYEQLSDYKSDFLLIDLFELIYSFYYLSHDKKQCRLCKNFMAINNKIFEKIPYKFEEINPVNSNIDFRVDIDNFIKNIKRIYDDDKIIFMEIYHTNKILLDNGLVRNIIAEELYKKQIIFLKKYFDYFLNNLNCKVLSFPNNSLCDPHHKWGINGMHFMSYVYNYAAPQIHAMINDTKTISFYRDLYMKNEYMSEQSYKDINSDMNKLKFEFIKIKSFHGFFLDYYDKKLYQYKEDEQPSNLNSIIFDKNKLCLQIKNTGEFINGFDHNAQIIISKKFSFFYIVYADNRFYICHNLKYLSARIDDIHSINLVPYPSNWEKFEGIEINNYPAVNNTLIISTPMSHQITFPNKVNPNRNSLFPVGIKIVNGSKSNINFDIDNNSIFKNCSIIVEKDNIGINNIEIYIDKNCILENVKIFARKGKLCIGENSIINDMDIKLNNNLIYIGKDCYLDGNNIISNLEDNAEHSDNIMIYDGVHYIDKNKFNFFMKYWLKILSFFGYKSLILYIQNFIMDSNNQINFIKSNIPICILRADPLLPFKNWQKNNE